MSVDSYDPFPGVEKESELNDNVNDENEHHGKSDSIYNTVTAKLSPNTQQKEDTQFSHNESQHAENQHKPTAISDYDDASESVQIRLEEFHRHLTTLMKENPSKYSNLLNNVPSFTSAAVTNSSVTVQSEKKTPERAFLLKFLRAGNYDCSVASKILINYILLMRDHPKYYLSSLCADKIQLVLKEKIHTVLPHRDKHGRRVFIWRPGKWNPTSFNFTDCYCAMYMLCEMMALEPKTQNKGCTVVCDGSNIGFKQLSSMGLEDIRNSANFIQVCIISFVTIVIFLTKL
jgi:hypothetical protein